ncbi:unnamed protein product [Phyllotreta striolata]|uniref:Small subunit processome component 20 homolog n=1 Tax=Phyllotreta striolata TaxID=444603 RepID=A0A9N9TIW0_PHYSR|nr:unnamed protein product [Phyllotreta striolata]
MKNKSLRHKDYNTFKFLPFLERINNINVDVFHKVQHEYTADDEDNETFFYQTLGKWDVLNLSTSYELFQKDIRSLKYTTLPQLLLIKDKIISILLQHVKKGDPLSLQPLLELIVALAKDLQKEFYNYFLEIIEILIGLLNTKDTEQLEWVFTCLAYLFKFLWRFLVKDINSIFLYLLPLLSENKPEYINNFAAESFAFVARKVKDKRSFLNVLLKAVSSHPDGTTGCGKLLFKVLYGIEGQFHSCAETLLPFLLESLLEERQEKSVLFEILEVIVSNIVVQIHPQKGDLLWTTYINILSNLTKKITTHPQDGVVHNTNYILKLVGHTVEHKQGKFLLKPAELVVVLMEILASFNEHEETLLVISQISILLLSSKHVKMSQEQASGITRKLLNVSYRKIFLYFVDNIQNVASFEAMVLPAFLRFCVKNQLDTECFRLLAKIIINKSPPCINGISLTNWAKYSVDFKDGNKSILEIITRNIKEDNSKLVEAFNEFYLSLICLPHLCASIDEELVTVLEEKIQFFTRCLKENSKESKKYLFLLNITLECLIHLKYDTKRLFELTTNQNVFDALLQFTSNPENISSIHTISLIISYLKQDEQYLSMDLLTSIHAVMEKNFNSPFREVRLLTAHIYAAFEHLPDFQLKHSSDPEVPVEPWKVFSLIYKTESIESNVSTYRDQLQYLEKLDFEKSQMSMCKQTAFKTVPLRYLCGTLYINFQLIWEPVIKIVASHAAGLDINTFWSVFGEELKLVPNSVSLPKNHVVNGTEGDSLDSISRKLHELTSKPDFVNHRILLWKALESFAHIAEAKTRDVSELMLSFMSNEYVIGTSDTFPTQSIKQNAPEDENHHSDNEEDSNSKSTTRTSSKVLIKTLIQKLKVLSQVRSPLSMYREPELYKLYIDLLQHKDSNVQKSALDCIFTYKHKFLTPYKQNLYNLIDEKNFKHEIRTFRVDKESNVILPEHREGLLPIVLQIVFGKMNVKTGLRTGGKSSGQMRRSVVFRFLADCQEHELLGFLKKLLRLYNPFLRDDPLEIVDGVYESCKLEGFLPLKRLLSTLNLIEVILEQCGGLLGDEILTYILKIIFVIGSSVKFAFDHIAEVHSGYSPLLRTLRGSCLKLIERFFNHFYKYSWSSQQINAIFSAFVWPYLKKLNTEGIHSPTHLLKLFVQWGSNPRYFPLLVKCKEDDKTTYVLPYVLDLLINEKCHISVSNIVEEMLEKLLNLQPDEEDSKNPIPVDNVLEIGVDDTIELNFGSKILLPHVPAVLTKIERKLCSKSKNLNQKELFILSRISELVTDRLHSDTILNLLLPLVVKKCRRNLPEEVTLRYINSIFNLIKNVDSPRAHLKQLSPLFGEVSNSSARKILCRILDVIATDEELKTTAALITELNAFDKKWIDQPDFERRHDAFKTLTQYINEDKLSLTLGIIAIHNCSFFIHHENDLSAKENSSHALKALASHLILKYAKQSDYIVNETLFGLIRNGMKSPKDDIRNEYISLLGHLARECPQSHFVLRDLNKYTNKADLEVDFFENLVHLQLHRHGRALLKFCQITRELTEALNPRTLTQFVLPLASHYLCKERYSNKNSVIDGAVETIGVACRILPWYQYEGLLRYYLSKLGSKLDFQKQLVKVIVAVLDAFHFDLKNAHPVEVQKKNADEENAVVNEANDEERAILNADVVEEAANGEEDDEELDLDNFVGNQNDTEDIEDVEVADDKVLIVDKVSLLCKSTATRVVKALHLVLIPKLHKSLAELTHYDTSHKVNRRKMHHENEDEDLLRIPISLALVKLLQKLPENILQSSLPGIFMKICTFLKSRLDSVRKVARETLQKIMLTLGPKYLASLLEEMSPLLGRGYQVHVLVFTIHGVLHCLKDVYQSGDLDRVLLTVLKFCISDIFGALSEEKEVAKIAVKVSEARHSKSNDTLQILAQYITESCLLDLILPIKRVLESSCSFKTAQKAQESLRYIASGLVDNSFVSTESLLKFAYGSSSEGIPQLIPQEKPKKSDKEIEMEKRGKEDCFIIPKVSGNRNTYRLQNVKNSSKANAHLLVEFGLRLCFTMLKREKVKDDVYKPFVDPFVEVFKKCLKAKHVKLCTLTLQCLAWVFKMDLPSLRSSIKLITKDIFAILHKYASAGLSKGDNFDLVVSAFKAMSILVRDVNYYNIDSNQSKILLLYVEQDIHNYERQATAFNLLKSILSKKINAPELAEVMDKVAELSVMSEVDHVRMQSRNVFHQYLMDYPMGNDLEKHLSFYLSQLSYEMRFGRESAIEMISTLINSFPLVVLKAQSATMFITLGVRLVNDEEPDCRKRIAECLLALLKKLPKADRDPLYDITLTWLKDKNINHRRLAAQICGIFVTTEKSLFETRLPPLLPLLLTQFGIDNSPGKLLLVKSKEEHSLTEEQQRTKDHHLFQALQLLLKLCLHCPAVLKERELVENLAVRVQSLLAYPHDWVRLSAAQFLGYVLHSIDADRLSNLIVSNEESEGYLARDPVNAVKSLTLDLCDQLQFVDIKSDLAEQVVKNLVFIAKVLQNVPVAENKPNLLWLTKRMRKIVNTEIVENASSIVLRTEVFKWIAGVSVTLDLENILPVAHHLLAPLVRELGTTEEKNAPLRHLAKEVANLVKEKIGADVYSEVLLKQQQHLSVKRAERKRTRTQLSVTDPESYAKRKIKRHEKKKEAKKRKIESLKGTKRIFKKRKTIDLEDN